MLTILVISFPVFLLGFKGYQNWSTHVGRHSAALMGNSRVLRTDKESIVVWFGSHVHVIYVNKAHVPQPEGGNGKASLTHTKHAQPTSVTMPVWA